MIQPQFNQETTEWLLSLQHPLEKDIQQIRAFILETHPDLCEITKWNAPNYTYVGIDCLTLKILPAKQIQLIFHRGAKKMEPISQHFIEDTSGILLWKENDRAIASFKNYAEFEQVATSIRTCILMWIQALDNKIS